MTQEDMLADLAERYWQFEKRRSPFGAFLAGQLGDEIKLFHESPAEIDRFAAEAAALRAEVARIGIDGLGPVDRATHALLDRELGMICAMHAVGAHLRPWLLPAGPDFNTVFYGNSAVVSDARTARLHVDRLATFPAFLQDVRACLAEGYARGMRYPHVVLTAAAANTRGIAGTAPEASAWYAAFAKTSAPDNPGVREQAERAVALIRDELIPAFHAYADFIDGPLADGARESIACTDSPDGEAYYTLMAQNFTTTGMTPRAIHELGLGEVARIDAELERTYAEAGFAGDRAAYRTWLATDPACVESEAEALREKVEVVCKRIDSRIPAFFSRIPRITYGVETVPPALSVSMPAAYAQPAPSGGETAGLFWITGLPEKCPTYIIPALCVHEAWPGHLMHIGLMAELEHLPAFRRYGAVKYTACVEGWALYCEHLGMDMGVYKTPHHHYGRLEMEMWRACRLVVDTGIHAMGWSREQAIAYMVAHVSLPREALAAEVDRYIALPGQALAYQIGGLKFRELRARAEVALGDSFSLRAFHETVMTVGGVTLPVLEDAVDGWIAERQAA
jgi:uncharacterized protein (DUF885 family)